MNITVFLKYNESFLDRCEHVQPLMKESSISIFLLLMHCDHVITNQISPQLPKLLFRILTKPKSTSKLFLSSFSRSIIKRKFHFYSSRYLFVSDCDLDLEP